MSQELREQIDKFKNWGIIKEEKDNLIVYHGTPDEHEFNKRGYLSNGTFFSDSKDEAGGYGKHLYRVRLKSDLNLLSTNKLEDCELIINNFGPLVDPYYNEDEEGYYINTAEELYHNSDSWSSIEYDRNLMEWIEGNYDGVWVNEGGTNSLLLFKPVKDKIISIDKIR